VAARCGRAEGGLLIGPCHQCQAWSLIKSAFEEAKEEEEEPEPPPLAVHRKRWMLQLGKLTLVA
jgi:hypothetical protein